MGMKKPRPLGVAAREDSKTLKDLGVFRDACEDSAGRRVAPIAEGKRRELDPARHAAYKLHLYWFRCKQFCGYSLLTGLCVRLMVLFAAAKSRPYWLNPLPNSEQNGTDC
jgi:hypothetical protein